MQQPVFFQTDPESALAALWDGGRFPHLLVIAGTPGSGRRTLALHAAALLLCRSAQGAPCGGCLSCRKLKSGNHPDLILVEGEGKTKSIGVDRIRQMRAEAFLAPHESARRVFLIPDAQSMTAQAQNAFLKLAEEPPAPDYFLLTATGPRDLLETLQSRAAVVSTQELDGAQRLEALQRLRPQIPQADLLRAAQASPTVGQALRALEDSGAQKRADDAAALFESILRRDLYEVMRLFAQYEKDREQFVQLVTALRATCISRLAARQIPAAQGLRLAGILEQAAGAAAQNVGLPLLSAVTAKRLTSAGIS